MALASQLEGEKRLSLDNEKMIGVVLNGSGSEREVEPRFKFRFGRDDVGFWCFHSSCASVSATDERRPRGRQRLYFPSCSLGVARHQSGKPFHRSEQTIKRSKRAATLSNPVWCFYPVSSSSLLSQGLKNTAPRLPCNAKDHRGQEETGV